MFINNLPTLNLSTSTSTVIIPVVDISTDPGVTKKVTIATLASLARGPSGSRGFPGAVGPQGASGPQGNLGPSGTQGTFGPQGPQGPSGVSNVSGPKGPVGPSGPSGPRGPSGVSNVSGPTGAIGPSGPSGVAGPSGADSTISGPSGSRGSQGPSGPRGVQGSQGRIGPQGLIGPQGDPGGPSGPIGPSGVSGPAGIDGPSGVSGPQGEPGSPGGPSGPQGSNGPQGNQGDQGPSGPAISGPSGPSGARGVSGPSGSIGSVGPSGPSISGPSGPSGSAGPSGPSGPSISGPSGPAATEISTVSNLTVASILSTTSSAKFSAIENSFVRIRGVPSQDPSPSNANLLGSNGLILTSSRFSAQSGSRNPVLQDDSIGFIAMRGTTVTNATSDPQLNQISIFGNATETPSATAAGARLTIQTMNSGTVTMGTRMILSDAQNFYNATAHTFQASQGGTVFATVNGNSLQLGRGFRNSVYNYGSVSGTIAPTVNSGTVQYMTLTGDITINTMTSVLSGNEATFILIQDGIGGHTLTSTMLFENGSKTLSTAPGAIDVMDVRYINGVWYARLTTNYS